MRPIPSPTADVAVKILGGYAAHVPEHLNIVEIGVYQGRTLIQMAQNAKAHVYGIDPWEDAKYDDLLKRKRYARAINRAHTERHLKMFGVRDKVTLIQGFATEVGNTWNDGPVGLWFHDGMHDFATVTDDMLAWRRHWADEATIVFDDYWDDHPGVMAAVQYALDAGWLELEIVLADRLAVCRKR